jgi:hypothetical protein
MIILIIVVFVLVNIISTKEHASGWGNDPSGGIGLVLAVFAVLLMIGRI